MKKRFMCLLMVFMLCLCTAFSASAESLADDKQPGNVVTMSVSVPGTVKPMYSSIPANASGYISGSYSTLPCILGKYVSSGYMQVTVTPNGASGVVSCSVILPNGAYKYLGTVPASGGSTPMVPMYTLKAGTYTFTFQSSITEQIYVSCSIFE